MQSGFLTYMIFHNANLMWNALENFLDKNAIEESAEVDRFYVFAFFGVFASGMVTYLHSVYVYGYLLGEDEKTKAKTEEVEDKKES